MPDVFTRKKRSEVMSRIRSRGNKGTELRLVAVFRAQGITGWRRHLPLRIADFRLRIEAAAPGELRIAEPGLLYGSASSKSGIAVARSSRGDEAQTFSGDAEHQARVSSRRLLPLKIRPDFVFLEKKIAVFVDGCFWHGCPRCYVRPGQNREFWDAKRESNRARDKRQTNALRRAGWRVLRIWEHELARKNEARLRRRLRRMLTAR